MRIIAKVLVIAVFALIGYGIVDEIKRHSQIVEWLDARDTVHKKHECTLTSENEVMQRYDCKDGMQLIYTKATK